MTADRGKEGKEGEIGGGGHRNVSGALTATVTRGARAQHRPVNRGVRQVEN